MNIFALVGLLFFETAAGKRFDWTGSSEGAFLSGSRLCSEFLKVSRIKAILGKFDLILLINHFMVFA